MNFPVYWVVASVDFNTYVTVYCLKNYNFCSFENCFMLCKISALNKESNFEVERKIDMINES